jgi:Leucine-rich repeat (LRR) protein
VLLLDHNRISEVPDSLFHLPKLERLSLSHNQLTRLPRGVAHLQQLKYIDISKNKIRSISSAIAGCRMLEELRCCDNMITKLPVDLAKLEKLRIVVAENNRIETVPSAIFMYCESLQTLALHGNPVEMKDIESVKGYHEFEERRKRLYDKAVSAGVLLGKQEEPASRTVLTMSNVTSE